MEKISLKILLLTGDSLASIFRRMIKGLTHAKKHLGPEVSDLYFLLLLILIPLVGESKFERLEGPKVGSLFRKFLPSCVLTRKNLPAKVLRVSFTN